MIEDLMIRNSNILVQKIDNRLTDLQTHKTATIIRILPKHIKHNGMRSMEEPIVHRNAQSRELYDISNYAVQYNGEELTIGSIVGVSDWL